MITFQKESFKDIHKELLPLWDKHYQEIAIDKDTIELNPHIEGYEEFDELGGLIIFTLRDNKELIGYSFFILQYSLHYKQVICAVNDLFYILPEYRGRMLGSKFIKESEEILKEMGIHQIQMRTKSYANFGKLLERAGYKEVEIAYRKNINIPTKGGNDG